MMVKRSVWFHFNTEELDEECAINFFSAYKQNDCIRIAIFLS